MIRIMTASEPKANTITVDGQLTGDFVDAVERCVDQAMGQGRSVHLFLREVSNIDERGRALLQRLAAKGVHLSAAGVYSAYIVEAVRQEKPSSANGKAGPARATIRFGTNPKRQL